MKNLKYTFIVLIIFLINIVGVRADDGYCSRSDLKRIQEIADNITIEYELSTDENATGLFNLKITGLNNELSIKETTTGMTYTSASNVDGVITINNISGSDFVFKIYYTVCDSKLIRTEKLSLPKYNRFSATSYCEDIPADIIKECDPWYQGEIDKDEVIAKIEAYRKSLESQDKESNSFLNKVFDFFTKYYLYIIGIIVIIIIVSVVLSYRKKRGSFE